MALSGTVVWECQTGGDDLNGGGFNSAAAGVDRSQSTSPHVTIDGATVSATVHSTTSQITLTGYTVSSDDVGNIVYISGGTATSGRYEIVSVDVGNNRWVLDRSAGTAAQTVQGRMGGCAKYVGAIASAFVASNKVWVKAGTYTLTTSTPGSGGPVSIGVGMVSIEGYQTTRGDLGNPPVFDVGAQTGVTVFSLSNANFISNLKNLAVDGQGNSTITAFGSANRAILSFCVAMDCTTGFNDSDVCIQCMAIDCTTGFNNCNTSFSEANGCTTGFSTGVNVSNVFCGAIECTVGISLSAGGVVYNSIAYKCSSDGFSFASTSGTAINCISAANEGWNYNGNGDIGTRIINCAGYVTTGSGNVNGTGNLVDGFITLTGNPFVDPDNDDFTLNDTAGAGADCRAGGISPYGRTGKLDLGFLQHADPPPTEAPFTGIQALEYHVGI